MAKVLLWNFLSFGGFSLGISITQKNEHQDIISVLRREGFSIVLSPQTSEGSDAEIDCAVGSVELVFLL